MKNVKILLIALAACAFFCLASLECSEKAGGAACALAATGMVAGIAGKKEEAPDTLAGEVAPTTETAGETPVPETGAQDAAAPENLKIPLSEFNALKAKHKHLYVLDIRLPAAETYQFVACRPSRLLIDLIATTKEVAKINDLLLKNMIVAGNREALDDGLVYTAVLRELAKITRQASGFLARA